MEDYLEKNRISNISEIRGDSVTGREHKMSKETEYRIEHDSIGEKQIPKDAYYGVQTLRAAEKFFHHRSEDASGVYQ